MRWARRLGWGSTALIAIHVGNVFFALSDLPDNAAITWSALVAFPFLVALIYTILWDGPRATANLFRRRPPRSGAAAGSG
jgi:hypothetical protein